MWYRQKDDIVLILIISQETLFLVLAHELYKKQCSILSYTSFKSSSYELKDGIIYNYRAISCAISFFLKKQNVKPSFLTVILDNSQVIGHFFVAVQPTSEKSKEKIGYRQTSHTHYIGPCQDTDHLLYSCRVSDSVLLQYQLLVSLLNIPLLNIACSMHALLYAYRGCKKSAFRSSELVKDILYYDKNFIDFFTSNMVYRLVYNLPTFDHAYKKYFLMTYGHLFYQEMCYEQA
ncbi:MAG TPA: hypothetical protein VL201_03570 [Patescibacteria group bacterium]|jgi:hypothetical protein|nr:hypothetical protein [Patescibacteria group bacterium]